MNADTHADIVRIVDQKISEVFKKYSTTHEVEEDKEDIQMKTEITELNKKIDNLTNLITKLAAGNSIGIAGDQQQPRTTTAPKTKKEEVFIPTIENNESIVSNKNTNTKTIKSNNIDDALSALNKLK